MIQEFHKLAKDVGSPLMILRDSAYLKPRVEDAIRWLRLSDKGKVITVKEMVCLLVIAFTKYNIL